LQASFYAEQRGERGYLGLLSVAPQRQRSGIGARLITAAEEHCRSAGCRFMDLTFVNVRKELPRYYHRLGYVKNGTFPADQNVNIPVHLIRMSKLL
jgi:GNAT superfamily N-acetyltransferase